MKGKLGIAVGLAAGYVLGTRAGRERYQQIVDRFRTMREAMRSRDEAAAEPWDEPAVTTLGSGERGQSGSTHGA